MATSNRVMKIAEKEIKNKKLSKDKLMIVKDVIKKGKKNVRSKK